MRYSTFLEVNLNLLSENLKQIQSLAQCSQILPMVKANAYGNGLTDISHFLVNECGINFLGCASLGEAVELRRNGINQAHIVVFSDTELQSDWNKLYHEMRIIPVIHLKEDLDYILNNAEFKLLPLYLKLNTGMNRLGLSEEDLEPFLPQLKDRGIEHLMTHFACSYFPLKEGDRTHRQYEKFQLIKKNLQSSGVSIKSTSVSNSGAIEQGFGVNESFIRPGLMLYGPYSTGAEYWKGHQISSLQTKILKTMVVKKGTPVGYGNHVAPDDCLIGVIPIGYGDGLMTYSSGVKVIVENQVGEIFARVNMDMAFLKFPLNATDHIKNGSSVLIWNHDNQVICEMAEKMKTIPYQLMCGLSTRVPRIYKR